MRKILFIFLFPILLIAPPHEFADVKAELNFKNKLLENIVIFWTFDEMASQMIIMNFDADGDNSISNDELNVIETESFKQLKEFNYYTFLKINGEKLALAEYDYFNVLLKDNKVIFKYKILSNKITKPVSNLELYINDPEYYTAFKLQKNDVRIMGLSPNEYSITVNEKEINYYMCHVLDLKVL